MYCAYVTTIKEIRKHSNADRLNCATIFGNNVILDLSFQVGDRVVYFPSDGQLGKEFAEANNLLRKLDADGNNVGGYLDPDKRNIKALKLRGEISDGLVLPLSCLAPYTNINSLKDGDQITVLGGHEICRKYVPQNNSKASSAQGVDTKKKIPQTKYPFFIEHADTDQLAYNQAAFKPGDTCYITLKMHGTSARTANALSVTTKPKSFWDKLFKREAKQTQGYGVISGTRRTVLSNYSGGYYGSNEFRLPWHEFFASRLPKGVEVYYEIVGWVDSNKTVMAKANNSLIKDKAFSKQYGSQTIFSYGCEQGENKAFVYRMTMMNEDGFMVEIPWEQVKLLCEKMGVPHVPEFEKFTYTTWEDLMERVEKYYDGADPVGRTHIREGVVVRIDNRPSFTAYKHKNFYFKALEGMVKDTSDAPDMEEAEELAV